MEIAKQLAGFSPAEADDLRKAIGKKIHSLMASLKGKFLEGCAGERRLARRRQPALGRHGAGAGLLLQQVARRVLRADRVSHRVAAREPPEGVHGRAHLLGHEHEGQGAVLRQRVRRARHRGAAARREHVADRLRRRRGEDPLRAERGEERRRVGLPRDRARARGGRAVRVDLGLHRARRPAGREQARARVARQGGRARLDRRVAQGHARVARAGARRGGRSSSPTSCSARARSSTSARWPARRRRGTIRRLAADEFDKSELLQHGEGEPRPVRVRASAVGRSATSCDARRTARCRSSSAAATARSSSSAASSRRSSS